MAPVLFTIGPFSAYSFGFFLGLSFIISSFIIWRYGREELKEEEYLDVFLYTNLIVLIGARFIYIITHFDQFGINILRYIVVREAPGLSLVGGLLGGVLFLWYYCRKKKLSFAHLLDLFSVAYSLALFFSKVGEQFGGAGFGRETNLILGVKIIGKTGRYHPVELYESLCFLILFITLSLLYQKSRWRKWPEGTVSLVASLAIASIIFLIEFLKVKTVYLYTLSLNQVIALIIIIALIKPLYSVIKKIRMFKRDV